MSILAVISAGFIVALSLTTLTRVHPAAFGCLLPVAASGLVFAQMLLWPSGSSTDGLAVPFMFAWVAIGSVAGAAIGGWMRLKQDESS